MFARFRLPATAAPRALISFVLSFRCDCSPTGREVCCVSDPHRGKGDSNLTMMKEVQGERRQKHHVSRRWVWMLYHCVVVVGATAEYSIYFSIVLRWVDIHCAVVEKRSLPCQETNLGAPVSGTVSLQKRLNFNKFSTSGSTFFFPSHLQLENFFFSRSRRQKRAFKG